MCCLYAKSYQCKNTQFPLKLHRNFTGTHRLNSHCIFDGMKLTIRYYMLMGIPNHSVNTCKNMRWKKKTDLIS